MKRVIVLATIVIVGAASYTVSAQLPQGPTPASLAASKIEKVKDNLYVITGSGAADMNAFSGGNTAVFITETGVTLVDTKMPGFGPMLLERIKSVTDKPVTRIINTHAHPDHMGSNNFFAAPVEIVVHEGARANASMAGTRVSRSYKDRLTIGSGRDQIDLYHFGRGHTNGDTFVVFRAARTMHVGEMFAWKATPFIDVEGGGSVVEHPATLEKAIAGVKDVDTVISGHIPTATWSDLREYADFSRDFVRHAEAARKAGKSVAQAAAEYKVPERFKGYVAGVMVPPEANLKIAYDELAKR